jgi:hypothetical protein
MKKVWCVSLLLVLAMAMPAWSATGTMTGAMAPVQVSEMWQGRAPNVGTSLLAALSNIFYFPLRFTVTVVTAEVGGLTGWMTGGDVTAAQAVWRSTDGQAYITPGVIEGRERLRFGRLQ